MPRHKISYYNSPLVYSFYILDDKLAFRIIITFLCPFLPQCECGSDIQPAKRGKENIVKKVHTILLLLLLQLRLLRTFRSIFPTTFHGKIGVDRTRWNSIYSYIQLERMCTLDTFVFCAAKHCKRHLLFAKNKCLMWMKIDFNPPIHSYDLLQYLRVVDPRK